jgi:outer membrane lipoprotein LolB
MNALKSLFFILVCFLTACTTGTKPAAEEPTNKIMPVEKRKAQTASISSWELNGAMAAKSKNKGWSATMNWVQHGPSSYQIRLIGPLGGGTVLISRSGGTITVQDGAQKSSSTNASKLLLEKTGINLPVNNLYYWVRGLPAPGSKGSEQHDRYGHLTHLQQDGYSIGFTKYTSAKGTDLPSMIRLEGNGILIKVVVKSWQVSS